MICKSTETQVNDIDKCIFFLHLKILIENDVFPPIYQFCISSGMIISSEDKLFHNKSLKYKKNTIFFSQELIYYQVTRK